MMSETDKAKQLIIQQIETRQNKLKELDEIRKRKEQENQITGEVFKDQTPVAKEEKTTVEDLRRSINAVFPDQFTMPREQGFLSTESPMLANQSYLDILAKQRPLTETIEPYDQYQPIITDDIKEYIQNIKKFGKSIENDPDKKTAVELTNFLIDIGINDKPISTPIFNIAAPILQGKKKIDQGFKEIVNGEILRGTGRATAGALQTAFNLLPAVVGLNMTMPTIKIIGFETDKAFGGDGSKGVEIAQKLAPFLFGKWIGLGSLAADKTDELVKDSQMFRELFPNPDDQLIARDLLHNIILLGTVAAGRKVDQKVINPMLDTYFPYTRGIKFDPKNNRVRKVVEQFSKEFEYRKRTEGVDKARQWAETELQNIIKNVPPEFISNLKIDIKNLFNKGKKKESGERQQQQTDQTAEPVINEPNAPQPANNQLKPSVKLLKGRGEPKSKPAALLPPPVKPKGEAKDLPEERSKPEFDYGTRTEQELFGWSRKQQKLADRLAQDIKQRLNREGITLPEKPRSKEQVQNDNLLQLEIMQKAGIPEEKMSDYALSSVADGKILRSYIEQVKKGEITKEQAIENVKSDYQKMIEGEKPAEYLEQKTEAKPELKPREIEDKQKLERTIELTKKQLAELEQQAGNDLQIVSIAKSRKTELDLLETKKNALYEEPDKLSNEDLTKATEYLSKQKNITDALRERKKLLNNELEKRQLKQGKKPEAKENLSQLDIKEFVKQNKSKIITNEFDKEAENKLKELAKENPEIENLLKSDKNKILSEFKQKAKTELSNINLKELYPEAKSNFENVPEKLKNVANAIDIMIAEAKKSGNNKLIGKAINYLSKNRELLKYSVASKKTIDGFRELIKKSEPANKVKKVKSLLPGETKIYNAQEIQDESKKLKWILETGEVIKFESTGTKIFTNINGNYKVRSNVKIEIKNEGDETFPRFIFNVIREEAKPEQPKTGAEPEQPKTEAKPEQPKEEPKKATEIGTKKQHIVDVNVHSVKTDVENFQGRTENYSTLSFYKIVGGKVRQALDDGEIGEAKAKEILEKANEYNKENNLGQDPNLTLETLPPKRFYWNEFGQIALWENNKGELIVLGGHSRLASSKFLSKYFDEFGEIPAVIYKETDGIDFEEAKALALESNYGATQQSLAANIKYLQQLRQSQTPEQEIKIRSKQFFGKEGSLIYTYSHLSPDGYTMQMLKSSDVDNTAKEIAKWIGRAREIYPFLTDSHENEMYKFLVEEAGYGNKVKNLTAWLDYLDRRVTNTFWDNSQPLNLLNVKTKSEGEKAWENDVLEAEQKLKEAQEEHQKKAIVFEKQGLNPEQIREKLKPFVEMVNRYAMELAKIKADKDKYLEQDKSQGMLFEPTLKYETQSREAKLREWIKNSKIVDEWGNPVIVFSATKSNLQYFNPKLSSKKNYFGASFYTSTNYDDVEKHYLGSNPEKRIKAKTIRDNIINELSQLPKISPDKLQDKLNDIFYNYDILRQPTLTNIVSDIIQELDRMSKINNPSRKKLQDLENELFEEILNEISNDTIIEIYLNIKNPFIVHPITGTSKATFRNWQEESTFTFDQLINSINSISNKYNLTEEQTNSIENNLKEFLYNYFPDILDIPKYLTREEFITQNYNLDKQIPARVLPQLIVKLTQLYDEIKKNDGEFLKDIVISLGYDGAIMVDANEHFGFSDIKTEHIIAFFPEQIKSVEAKDFANDYMIMHEPETKYNLSNELAFYESIFNEHNTNPIYKAIPFIASTTKNFIVGSGKFNSKEPVKNFILSKDRPLIINLSEYKDGKLSQQAAIKFIRNNLNLNNDDVKQLYYFSNYTINKAEAELVVPKNYKELSVSERYEIIRDRILKNRKINDAMIKIANKMLPDIDKLLFSDDDDIEIEAKNYFELDIGDIAELLNSKYPVVIKGKNNEYGIIAPANTRLLNIEQEIDTKGIIKGLQAEEIIKELKDNKNDVIVYHSISADKLKQAIINNNKLIMPSLALTKRGFGRIHEYLMHSFGANQVVLIGDKNLITSKDVEIRDADFYSGVVEYTGVYKFEGDLAVQLVSNMIADINNEINKRDKKQPKEFEQLAEDILDRIFGKNEDIILSFTEKRFIEQEIIKSLNLEQNRKVSNLGDAYQSIFSPIEDLLVKYNIKPKALFEHPEMGVLVEKEEYMEAIKQIKENDIYSFGRLKGMVANILHGIDDIGKNKHKLINKFTFPDSEYRKLIDKINKLFENRAIDAYTSNQTKANLRTLIESIRDNYLEAGSTEEIVRGLIENEPDEFTEDQYPLLYEIIQDLKDLRPDYFEAKVYKEVDLSEFRFAIVNANLKDIADKLTEAGVEVIQQDIIPNYQIISYVADKVAEQDLFNDYSGSGSLFGNDDATTPQGKSKEARELAELKARKTHLTLVVENAKSMGINNLMPNTNKTYGQAMLEALGELNKIEIKIKKIQEMLGKLKPENQIDLFGGMIDEGTKSIEAKPNYDVNKAIDDQLKLFDEQLQLFYDDDFMKEKIEKEIDTLETAKNQFNVDPTKVNEMLKDKKEIYDKMISIAEEFAKELEKGMTQTKLSDIKSDKIKLWQDYLNEIKNSEYLKANVNTKDILKMQFKNIIDNLFSAFEIGLNPTEFNFIKLTEKKYIHSSFIQKYVLDKYKGISNIEAVPLLKKLKKDEPLKVPADLTSLIKEINNIKDAPSTIQEKIYHRIADIFDHLNDQTVEHPYLCIALKDLEPIVLKLGEGTEGEAPVNIKQYLPYIYELLDKDKVAGIYMVHNHPSGRLHFSPQDHSLMKYINNIFIKYSKIDIKGIIIDRIRGIYSIFSGDNYDLKFLNYQNIYEQLPRKMLTKSYRISPQRLLEPLFIAGSYNSKLTEHYVKFIYQTRFSAQPKEYALMLDNQLNIKAVLPVVIGNKIGYAKDVSEEIEKIAVNISNFAKANNIDNVIILRTNVKLHGSEISDLLEYEELMFRIKRLLPNDTALVDVVSILDYEKDNYRLIFHSTRQSSAEPDYYTTVKHAIENDDLMPFETAFKNQSGMFEDIRPYLYVKEPEMEYNKFEKAMREFEKQMPARLSPDEEARLKELNSYLELTPDEKKELAELRAKKREIFAKNPVMKKRLSTWIKDKIRLYKKGYREGQIDLSRALRKIERDIVDYAREVLPKYYFKKSEIIKAMVRLKEARDFESMETAFDVIDGIAETVIKRMVYEKLNSLFRRVNKDSRAKGVPNSVINLKHAKFNPEKLEGLIQKIGAIEQQRPLTEDEEIELYFATNFLKIKSMPIEEVSKLTTEFENYIKGRMFNFKEWLNKEKIRKEELRKRAMSVITGGKGVLPEDIQRLKELKQTKPKYIVHKLLQYDNMMHSFEWLMDAISKFDKSEPLNSFLNKYFADGITQATINKNDGIKKYKEIIKNGLEETFGLKGKELYDLLDEFSEIKPTGIKIKIPKQKEDGTTEFEEQELVMSQNEIAKLLLEWEDPTLAKTFEKMNIDPVTIHQLRNYLHPKMKEWIKWNRNFYNEYYLTINEVYKKVKGYDLPYNPFYSPIQRDVQPTQLEQEFLGEQYEYVSIYNGHLQPRVSNTNPLKRQDINMVLIQHVVEMEHFKHYAPIVLDMRNVFGNKEIRKAIIQYHDSFILRVINKFVNDFARGGQDHKQVYTFLDKLRGNFAVAKIGINPTVMVKQLTSFPAYMMEIPASEFFIGVADFMLNPIGKAKLLYRSSKYMQSRYNKGWEREIVLALSRARQTFKKQISGKPTFTELAMYLAKVGDGSAIMLGGWSVYRYWNKYWIKQGLSSAEAHKRAIFEFEKATKRSQQSGEIEDLGEMQRGGSWATLWTLFKTAPKSYYSSTSGAIRNLYYGRGNKAKLLKRLFIAHFLLPVFFQFAADGFEAKWKHLLRAAIIGSFNGIFIIGDLAELIVKELFQEKTWDFEGNPIESIAKETLTAVKQLSKFASREQITIEDFFETLHLLGIALGSYTGIPYQPISRVVGGTKEFIENPDVTKPMRILGFSENILKDDEEEVLPPEVKLIKEKESRLNKLRREARETLNKKTIDKAKELKLEIDKLKEGKQWKEYLKMQNEKRKQDIFYDKPKQKQKNFLPELNFDLELK